MAETRQHGEAKITWVRENHRVYITKVYAGDCYSWYCSCGTGDHQVTMPHRNAQSAKTRHLRAQERRFDREYVPAQNDPEAQRE